MNNLAPCVWGCKVGQISYNFKPVYFHIYKQINTYLSPFMYPLGQKSGPLIILTLKECIIKFIFM